MINRKKEAIAFDIVVVFVIAVIVLIQAANLYVPYLQTDEYGYLRSAAFFAGLDWPQNMSKQTGYFSYVYGLVISPILRLCSDSLIVYRCIQVINVIILIINYFVLQKIIMSLNLSANMLLRKFISGIATLYCSNIVFGKCVLPECFLALLFNVNIYLFYKLCETKNWVYCILLACGNMLLCTMHQRTISIFAATVVTLIIMRISKNEISAKQIILFIVIVAIGLILYKIGKSFIIKKVWLNAPVAEFQSYGTQVKRLSFIFSIEGWCSFICSILGKMFYLMVSTSLMLLYFFKGCYRKIIECHKKKNNEKLLYLYIFLLLAFVFTVGISCLFINNPTSTTYLFYGRYNEYIIGIYIVVGLFEFLNNRTVKFDAICIVGFIVVSLICKEFTSYAKIDIGNCAILTPAITCFYNVENNFEMDMCVLSAIIVFILLIIIRESTYIKEKMAVIGVVLLYVNIWTGFSAFNDFFQESTVKIHNAIVNVTEVIQNIQLNENSQICVVEADNKKIEGKYARTVQFILRDIDIDSCNPEEIMQEYEKYDMVISLDNLWIPTDEMQLVYSEEGISLYCSQEIEKLNRYNGD